MTFDFPTVPGELKDSYVGLFYPAKVRESGYTEGDFGTRLRYRDVE